MKLTLSIVSLAAALFCAGSVQAAEAEFDLRFALLGSNADAAAWATNLPRQYHLHDAAGTKKLGSVLLRSTGLDPRSQQVAATEGSIVLTTDPDPGSVRNPEQVLGTFTPPAGASSLILLLLPRGPELIGSHAVALDSDAKAFPSGATKCVNLSQGPVRFEIDGKTTEVAPGAIQPLVSLGDVPKRVMAEVKAYHLEKEAWLAFYASKWPLMSSQRGIQVVYPVPGSPARLEVVGFTDKSGRGP